MAPVFKALLGIWDEDILVLKGRKSREDKDLEATAEASSVSVRVHVHCH